MKILRNEWVEKKQALIKEIGTKEPNKEQSKQLAELDAKIKEFLQKELESETQRVMEVKDELIELKDKIYKKELSQGRMLQEARRIYKKSVELLMESRALKKEIREMK